MYLHNLSAGTLARLDTPLPGMRRSRVQSSGPAKHSFVEIGHEIISTAILSLPLIQAGQLSVMAKGCALSTG